MHALIASYRAILASDGLDVLIEDVRRAIETDRAYGDRSMPPLRIAAFCTATGRPAAELDL